VPPRPAPPASPGQRGFAYQHPEVLIAAAFVGGFVLATILKRLGR
jgi:hypothetical protein